MQWRKIKGYPGYKVSRDGRVRTTKGLGVTILKGSINTCGYRQVRLYKKGGGKGKLFRVHRLVAKYFIPNPYNKPHVNHKDCDKQNNNDWNLEWVTRVENAQHAVTNGKYNWSKLTPKQLRKLVRLVGKGKKCKNLTHIFGVSSATLYRQIRRYYAEHK